MEDNEVDIAIRMAARVTGQDEGLLKRIAMAESSLNTNAVNPKGGATGLYQFFPSTWNDAIDRFGKEFGIKRGADRKDPAISSLLTAARIRSDSKNLTKFLGRAPTDGEVYLSHFSGLTGSKRTLKALFTNPESSVEDVYSKRALKNNKGLMYNLDGTPRSVRVFANKIMNKVKIND